MYVDVGDEEVIRPTNWSCYTSPVIAERRTRPVLYYLFDSKAFFMSFLTRSLVSAAKSPFSLIGIFLFSLYFHP